MLRLALVIFLSYALLSVPEGYALENMTATQTDGSWSSGLVTRREGGVEFRAARAMPLDKEDRVGFVIDFPINRCSAVKPAVVMETPDWEWLDDLLDWDTAGVSADEIAVRVNEGELLGGSSMALVSPGDSWLHFRVAAESPEELLKELKRGSIVRIKFTYEGVDSYFRYSLTGSRAALRRARKLCHEPNNPSVGHPDSKYFPD
ncbi:hypothetical protein H0Z60_13375 [Ectothiorhodospiraceae bacterium WFHF3C12]|nr:hypothetical protein [Ectothiorhodospiraceae bacterium WFHF3C12]